MSSTEILHVEADDEECEKAVADCEKKIENVDRTREKTDQNVRTSLRRGFRMLSGMVGITTSLYSAIGGSLDPVGQAIIGMITSTISALQSISIAMASNPFTAAFAVITAGAAIVLSTVTLIDTINGVESSKQELRQAQDILRIFHSSYIFMKGLEG